MDWGDGANIPTTKKYACVLFVFCISHFVGFRTESNKQHHTTRGKKVAKSKQQKKQNKKQETENKTWDKIETHRKKQCNEKNCIPPHARKLTQPQEHTHKILQKIPYANRCLYTAAGCQNAFWLLQWWPFETTHQNNQPQHRPDFFFLLKYTRPLLPIVPP